MASIIREVGETFGALVKGFGVTFRNMFRKTVTENYPYEPVNFQPRYRGIHVLHRDENGLEKCVGCFLCAAACPANCICIEAAENTDTNRISAGERSASVCTSDYSRCLFCVYCVAACPTDAIPVLQTHTVFLRELLSGSFVEMSNFNGSVALRIFCILRFTQHQPVSDAEEFALFG